ncbi:unnamed protein product [Lepeophtheirus salmonis]|uniref:(salmon louse) hypothetical protein n=1 Tax=Lepeophtheirus salmonis TaxID=72036 RepID=A0A7R8CWW1_LEPSM|nr:unnamed protein product [Lepeophtheirus salmonis]CAF2955529.1 unnamed protein product [Lepeophtheirus salmonis]
MLLLHQDCLPHTLYLEKLQSEGKVCSKCNKELTGKMLKRDRSPPSALIRRLELTNAPLPNSTIIYKNSNDSKMAKLKRGLSTEDQEICNRLQKLIRGSSVQKEDDMIREAQDKIRLDGLMSDPDEEIMSRLAKLRGNCTEDSNIIKGAADNTEYSNIIKAATVEMECDTKESIDEIMKKTEKDAREGLKDIATDKELSKKIKDIHLSKETTSSPMDDIEQQNEENESKKVLQQILDEVAIEEKLGQIEELPTPDGDPITIMNKYTQRQIQKQINEEESECPWCVSFVMRMLVLDVLGVSLIFIVPDVSKNVTMTLMLMITKLQSLQLENS